jgi:putative transposase
MILFPNKYYHIYNRSINKELVFRSPENYVYFLSKYRKYVDDYIDTIAYCLMPTHFHFFIFVRDIKMESTSEVGSISHHDVIEARLNQLKNNIGVLLSSYAKAINKRYARHGSLFQEHTKAIEIDDLSYLLWLATYIHQNPVRAKLVNKIDDWEYSSYKDYIGIRNGTLPKKDLILNYYQSLDDFRKYSEEVLHEVHQKYWI